MRADLHLAATPRFARESFQWQLEYARLLTVRAKVSFQLDDLAAAGRASREAEQILVWLIELSPTHAEIQQELAKLASLEVPHRG